MDAKELKDLEILVKNLISIVNKMNNTKSSIWIQGMVWSQGMQLNWILSS